MAETAKEHLDRLEDAVYQLRDADLAPAVESIAALRAAVAEMETRIASLEEALREFDEFAWTAVEADCEEARVNLNRKIAKARAALSSTSSQPEPQPVEELPSTSKEDATDTRPRNTEIPAVGSELIAAERQRQIQVELLIAASRQIATLTTERDQARSDKREGWTAFKRMTERREVQQRERIHALEEALRPFAEYIEVRLAVFSRESRNAYPELLVSGKPGEPTADIRAEDWERARAAFRGSIP